MSIVDQIVQYEQRKIRTRALAYVNADRRKHGLPDLTQTERSAVAAFYLQTHPGAVAPAPAPTALYTDTFADLTHWYTLGSPYPVQSNYSRVTVVDPKAEGLPTDPFTRAAARFEHTAQDLQAGRYHDKALYIPQPPSDPNAGWKAVGLPAAECDHLTFSTSVLFPAGYTVGRAWVNVLQTKNQQIVGGSEGYQNPQWWVNVANSWVSGVSGPVLFLNHNNNQWGYTPKVVPVRFDTWTRLELEVAKDQFVELRIDGQVVERSTPSTYGRPIGPQPGDTEYVPGVGNYPGDVAGAVPSRLYHADFQIA